MVIDYIQGEHVYVCDPNNFWANGNYVAFDESTGKHSVRVGNERWLVDSNHIVPKNTHRKKEKKDDKNEHIEFDREGY